MPSGKANVRFRTSMDGGPALDGIVNDFEVMLLVRNEVSSTHIFLSVPGV